MSNLPTYTEQMRDGTDLQESEMQDAIQSMMDGTQSEENVEDFLITLGEKGESINEIVGAANALRTKASLIQAPDGAVDCCGTGGDGIGTYNISTAVAFVAAACGIPMAKHGNRAASSKSGAADVLEALGINLNLPNTALEDALREYNFAFLMAQKHHNSVKHVAAVRKKIGKRTIFNLIGPLANPAGTKRQLIGVFDKHYVPILAEALDKLGTESAWVVHGSDGLDEITVTGATHMAKMAQGCSILCGDLMPQDFGVERHDADALKGGNAEENAKALLGVLSGEKNAYRDIVLANAAAVLHIAEKTSDLIEASKLAAQAIDHGAALNTLNRYKDFTQKYGQAA